MNFGTSYATFLIGDPRLDSSILDLWSIAMATDLGSQVSNLWKARIVLVIWVI